MEKYNNANVWSTVEVAVFDAAVVQLLRSPQSSIAPELGTASDAVYFWVGTQLKPGSVDVAMGFQRMEARLDSSTYSPHRDMVRSRSSMSRTTHGAFASRDVRTHSQS